MSELNSGKIYIESYIKLQKIMECDVNVIEDYSFRSLIFK